MKIVDAIQYLKQNNFTENSQYEWINPILRKVINDEIIEVDINNLMCNISKRNNEFVDVTDEISTTISSDCLDIYKIKEISEVKNYGLLDIEEPIILNDGLNVFYGQNGVGKSSLFKALCDIFGLDNFKKCTPNINNNIREMKCKLKILDNDNNLIDIDTCENYSRPDNVKVFDNYISNFIVANDQKNEFEIPYLKQQYFYILRDILNEIDEKLGIVLDDVESDIHNTYEILGNDFDISDLKYGEIEIMTNGVKFTEIDAEELIKLEKEKSLLETDTSKILSNSYKDRLNDLNLILGALCYKNYEGDKVQYKSKYSIDYCNKYNKELKKYNNLKKIYEDTNSMNLNNYIPENWLVNKEWEKFINAGIDFVKTLSEKEQHLYTDSKCPFCNQDLEGKSKELLGAYKNIRNTYKEKIDALEKTFKLQKQELNNLDVFLNELEKYNKNINETFINGKQQELISIDIKKFKSIFTDMHSSIEALKDIENFDSEYCRTIIDRYIEIKSLIEKSIEEVSLNIDNKNNELEKLNEKIETLKMKKIIDNNYVKISKVIQDLKIIEDISSKKNQLTALKKNLSRLENSFSKESSMKIFIEKLHNEYKQLDLIPPSQLSIKPQKDIRQCRIGNYKISDIYSEGELKIHSLAEFFAEAEINNFTGVYIFDDPVNSLDFERVKYVKERIYKLLDSGNQVIIFTHNIYFLNSLISTEKDKINEIVKTKNQICIINETILSNKDKQIKQYSEKIKKKMEILEKMKPNEIDKYEISSVYDLISGCLESYVENRLLNGLISRYRPNIRMFSLLDLKTINNDLIDKIYNLYDDTSRYGNRHSSPYEVLPPTYEKLEEDYKLFKEIINIK